MIPTYKHIPRHPHTFALIDLFSKKGLFEDRLISGMRKSDGSFEPVMNLGPWGNGSHYIAISDSESFRRILNDQESFPKTPNSYNWLSYLVGNGLVISTGALWKDQRKLITPLFHFNSLKNFVSPMVDFTRILIDQLKDSHEYRKAKDIFALHAMRIILHLAFGAEFCAEIMFNHWNLLTASFMNWTLGWCLFGSVWNYLPLPAASEFGRQREKLKSLILEVVDRRRKQMRADRFKNTRTDLLSCLLETESEDAPISDDLIVSQALTFMFAGYDTSSSSMAWTMYYLAEYPEVLEKVRQEADLYLDQNPIDDQFKKLNYTRNVIRESMRIRPVVPIVDRITTKDVVLSGKFIPAGTMLGLFFWNISHDSRYWEKPYDFIPDRWETEKIDNYTNLPFSAGPRNCLGSKFAMQEMIITISMIARDLNILYEKEKIISSYGVVIEPSNLRLKFLPRG